jgi:hypothetical protein
VLLLNGCSQNAPAPVPRPENVKQNSRKAPPEQAGEDPLVERLRLGGANVRIEQGSNGDRPDMKLSQPAPEHLPLLASLRQRYRIWFLELRNATQLVGSLSEEEIWTPGRKGEPYSERDLQAIAGLNELGVLHIQDTKSNGVALKNLASLPNLGEVILSGDQITDAALLALSANGASLKVLTIDSPLITDKGLVNLMKCPQLNSISLRRTQITSEGIAIIQSIPTLLVCEYNDLLAVDNIKDWSLRHTGTKPFVMSGPRQTSPPKWTPDELQKELDCWAQFYSKPQDAIVDSILKLGGMVQKQKHSIGPERSVYYGVVTHVTFTPTTEDDIALLRDLPFLKFVSLEGPAVDDDVLRGLLDLPRLQGVQVQNSAASNECINEVQLELRRRAFKDRLMRKSDL